MNARKRSNNTNSLLTDVLPNIRKRSTISRATVALASARTPRNHSAKRRPKTLTHEVTTDKSETTLCNILLQIKRRPHNVLDQIERRRHVVGRLAIDQRHIAVGLDGERRKRHVARLRLGSLRGDALRLHVVHDVVQELAKNGERGARRIGVDLDVGIFRC